MAPSNPKSKSKTSSLTKTNPSPTPPSLTTISTPESTPPVSSSTTHPTLFSITTLHTNPSTSQNPVYIIRPTQIWDSLSRYRDCIIPHAHPSTPTTLHLHSDISLHRPNPPHHQHNHHPSFPTILWYARILEIRAHSPHHVYLRIFWYYTPSQLPPSTHISIDAVRNGFRKGTGEEREGEGEVLPSNEMGVVRAEDVLGRVDVGVRRKGDGSGEGGLWREHRYDFWGGEVFEERDFVGERRGEEVEG